MGAPEPHDLTPHTIRPMSTIGRKLVPALRANGHRVILAGRTSGDVHVDLTSHSSIEAMYQQVDGVDGVVGIAAHGALDHFAATRNAEIQRISL